MNNTIVKRYETLVREHRVRNRAKFFWIAAWPFGIIMANIYLPAPVWIGLLALSNFHLFHIGYAEGRRFESWAKEARTAIEDLRKLLDRKPGQF